MNFTELDKIYNQNITLMYEHLGEVINESHLEQKETLLKFMKSNKNDVRKFICFLMITYSLLAFEGKPSEINQAKIEVQKLLNSMPILKEFGAIYYQMVSVKDINPELKEEESVKKQNILEQILFS